MSRTMVAVLMTVSILLSGTHAIAFEPVLVEKQSLSWGSVLGSPGGNPLVRFNGQLTAEKVTRERFVDVPVWIVSQDFDGDNASEAAVLFDDGTLRILKHSSDRLRTTATVRNMAPGSPPVVLGSLAGQSTGGLIGIDDRGNLVSIDYETGRTGRLASGFSPLTSPIAVDLDRDGEMEIAAVSDEGHMTIIKGRIQTRDDTSVKLLPDTRITVDDLDGDDVFEIVAFSIPVNDLSSSRLGDDLDARGLAIYNWDGKTLRLRSDYELPEGQVFQMLTPFIARESGAQENPVLMLTVSEEGQGSQIRSFSYDRGRIRDKRKGPLSEENEWIHVLGSTELGNSGNKSLIAVLVSDDDVGDLEIYRMDLAQTRITLDSSVNTHRTGSRLVDTVLIGDMDGDGQDELLSPGEDRNTLALFSLDRNRLRKKEVFNSSGEIRTNLCPGDFDGDGNSDVLFGMDDGTLVFLWGE